MSIPIDRNDEIGDMARAFQKMIERVNVREHELRESEIINCRLLGEKMVSEQRLRDSQDFAGIGSWDWDVVRGNLRWSDNIWPMFGFDKVEPEITYENYLGAVHPEDRGNVVQAINNCIENSEEYDIEHRTIWTDGTVRWLHERGNVLRDDQGKAVRMLGVVQDITNKKVAEKEREKIIDQLKQTNARLEDAKSQLLQADKMASIGQLAAGVAHEINNPVGYINSNLGSLKFYIDDLLKLLKVYEQAEDQLTSPEARQAIQTIKKEVELDFLKDDIIDLVNESQEGVNRVKQIVQDLKDFSHVDEAEWQWDDLHKGMDSTLNIVNNELKYKAEVIKEYGDLPHVECIISQLNQVFLNLLVNAAHAIDEHGTITIRTGTEADGVWIEIEDTGKGMDAEIRKKIFDPFFTTKPVGTGTGLGLSLSYGIIQKHHGSITVESEPGKGTRFHIWLPIEQKEKMVVA